MLNKFSLQAEIASVKRFNPLIPNIHANSPCMNCLHIVALIVLLKETLHLKVNKGAFTKFIKQSENKELKWYYDENRIFPI